MYICKYDSCDLNYFLITSMVLHKISFSTVVYEHILHFFEEYETSIISYYNEGAAEFIYSYSIFQP